MIVSDEDLMLECSKGDMSAFELLVRRYQDALVNYINFTINDYHRAEDLAQETFLRVFKSASRYKPKSTFKSWLYTIATNLSRNELRNRARRKTYYLEDLVDEDEDVYQSEFLIDTRLQPDILYEKKERQQLIKRTLNQLPENQRLALTLVTYQELSYEEISEILNCSIGAVKSLIHRARQNLKKLLIKTGIGDTIDAER